MNENLKTELLHFTGTENYYSHSIMGFGKFNYTDGVKYLVDNANCYWLLDIVSSYFKKTARYEFLIWELKVKDDKTAVITAKEDTNTKNVVRQEIPYTDFPLDYIKLYFRDNVLMLPREY